jgi:hypothetical protein
MTLIALLLLYPTPLLHPSGSDATSPGAQIRTLAAPVFSDQRAVSPSEDPAGGAMYAEDESDDQRAEFVLACHALPRPCRRDDLPSRLPSAPLSFPFSVRSPHLRC